MSGRPKITDLIRTHVRQMKARVEAGEPIRQMDPVFREVFEHHTKIRMNIDDIPGGVRVTETSDDPQVVLLIRQHAERRYRSSWLTGCSAHAPDAAPARLPTLGRGLGVPLLMDSPCLVWIDIRLIGSH